MEEFFTNALALLPLAEIPEAVARDLNPASFRPTLEDFLADISSIPGMGAFDLANEDWQQLGTFVAAAIMQSLVETEVRRYAGFLHTLRLNLSLLVAQVRRIKKFYNMKDQNLSIPFGYERPTVDMNTRIVERDMTSRGRGVEKSPPEFIPFAQTADRGILDRSSLRGDHSFDSGEAVIHSIAKFLPRIKEDKEHIDALTRVAGAHLSS
jgi:hypothetical protein